MGETMTDVDYRALAGFRRQLREFLAFSEAAATQAGITAQQHQAMLAIRAAPDRELPVGALAEQLHLRPHSASGLVDRLERAGLVVRASASQDRRGVSVSLTTAGEARIADLSSAHRAELRRRRGLLTAMLAEL